MNYSNNNIAFLLALNDQFILSMKVFLLSLLHTNKNFSNDILLLSDGNLSESNVNACKKIYKNIKVINAKKDDYVLCKKTKQTWGYNLYYRFDVFDMGNLGYDRIIIFDSDMVFLKPIDDLYSHNYDFAACEKYLNIPEIYPDNPLEQAKKRFNCGLMSISNRLLNNNVKKDLIEIASKQSWTSDQPVFNLYFADTVSYLSQKFNVVSSIATQKNLHDAVILQYHGFKKPWDSDNPQECFGDDVKNEIKKNCLLLNTTVAKLKSLFDDYAAIAKTY